MSYQEALEDKITMGKDYAGLRVFFPPCHICGASVHSWSYHSGTRYKCKKCREMEKLLHAV